MENVKREHIIIGAVIAVVAFVFYWYEYRPTTIRASCEQQAIAEASRLLKTKAEIETYLKDEADRGMYKIADEEVYYKSCLRAHGLPQ